MWTAAPPVLAVDPGLSALSDNRRCRAVANPIPLTDSAVSTAVTRATALHAPASSLSGAKTVGPSRCLAQRALPPARALR